MIQRMSSIVYNYGHIHHNITRCFKEPAQYRVDDQTAQEQSHIGQMNITGNSGNIIVNSVVAGYIGTLNFIIMNQTALNIHLLMENSKIAC